MYCIDKDDFFYLYTSKTVAFLKSSLSFENNLLKVVCVIVTTFEQELHAILLIHLYPADKYLGKP